MEEKILLLLADTVDRLAKTVERLERTQQELMANFADLSASLDTQTAAATQAVSDVQAAKTRDDAETAATQDTQPLIDKAAANTAAFQQISSIAQSISPAPANPSPPVGDTGTGGPQ